MVMVMFMFAQNTKKKRIEKNGLQLVGFRLANKSDDELTDERKYFRLDCELPVKFAHMYYTEPGLPASGKAHDGIALDLSGGGIRLSSNLKMQEKDRLIISLNLDGDDLFLIGEIRVTYDKSYYSDWFQYGVMFQGMTQTEQDKIVRYLLREQVRRASQMHNEQFHLSTVLHQSA